MKRFKRFLGVGLVAGLALSAVGVIAGSPAGATIKVGALNCFAQLPPPFPPGAGNSLQNPSVSQLVGPVWAAQGGAAVVTNPPGLTVLPRTASIATIGSFTGVTTVTQLDGVADPDGTGPLTGTTVAPTVTVVGAYGYDSDISDGITPGALPGGAATSVISGNGLTPQSWVLVTTVPGPLPTAAPAGPGPAGAALISPAIVVTWPNTGDTDGQIKHIQATTALTAGLIAPLVGAAPTTCSGSAEPIHAINVQKDGDPAVDSAPVVACQPAVNQTGTAKDSKGWWSDPSTLNFGGSLGGATKWAAPNGGCVAPDQKLNSWVAGKYGALAADAVLLDGADIKFKAKHYGNCTNVDLRNAGGQSHNANSPAAYEGNGTVSAKWLAGIATSKVKGSTAVVNMNIVVDQGLATTANFEAKGVVSKGTGIGGKFTFIAGLLESNADVAGIIDCNTNPLYGTGPAVPKYYGAVSLPIDTDAQSVLMVEAP